MTTAIDQMHQNSLTAYFSLDLDPRCRVILSVYEKEPNESFTDRQVKNRLGFEDMNQVRPRISGLVDKGILIECGHVKCGVTGKPVRLTKLYLGEKQEELF